MRTSAAVLFALIAGTTALDAPAPAPAPLVDLNPSCSGWANGGECTQNPAYMLATCSKSCSEVTTAAVPPPAPKSAAKVEPPKVEIKVEPKVVETKVEPNKVVETKVEPKVVETKVKPKEERKVAAKAPVEAAFEKDVAAVAKKMPAKNFLTAAKNTATKPVSKPTSLAKHAKTVLAATQASDSASDDEPYRPVTADAFAHRAVQAGNPQAASQKKVTTLKSTIFAVQTAKKTVTTLKSTLSNLHLHDKRDKKDTIKAEDKKVHGQKLSWHEKQLLREKEGIQKQQTYSRSPQRPANTHVGHAAADKAAADYNAAADAEKKAVIEQQRVARQAEIREQQLETEETEKRLNKNESGSWGNFIFISIVVVFLGWFGTMCALQTEVGKQVAMSMSGLMVGAGMGSKSLGKVKSALHRAASGDAYHFA